MSRSKTTDEQVRQIYTLRMQGVRPKHIAEMTKANIGTVSFYLSTFRDMLRQETPSRDFPPLRAGVSRTKTLMRELIASDKEHGNENR